MRGFGAHAIWIIHFDSLQSPQWSFNSTNAFYPFNAPLPPAIVRGAAPGADRVVTLNVKDNQWEVTALDIVSGASTERPTAATVTLALLQFLTSFLSTFASLQAKPCGMPSSPAMQLTLALWA